MNSKSDVTHLIKWMEERRDRYEAEAMDATSPLRVELMRVSQNLSVEVLSILEAYHRGELVERVSS